MKLIKAIVRSNKLDDVRAALDKASLSGMTVTEVRGHGHQKGHKAVYRGREYDVSLLPKTMIELVVGDNSLTLVLQPGTLDLLMLITVDQQGGRSVFTFTNLKLNGLRAPDFRPRARSPKPEAYML
jgi:outer membrane lipoprotein-sorting protein